MKKCLVLFFTTIIAISILMFSSCTEKVEFSVRFVVDGNIYETISTTGDEIIKMPQDPQKEGYTFDGWYWDNGTWNKPFTANSLLDQPLSSNMSVYAKFTCKHSQMTELNTPAKILSISGGEIEGLNISMFVKKDVSQVSLSPIITATSDTNWRLYKDALGQTEVPTKIAVLNSGYNTYYVVATSKDGNTINVYTMSVYRAFDVQIKYYDNTTLLNTVTVETNTEYYADYGYNKTGYTFNKWLNSDKEEYTPHIIWQSENIYADTTANTYTITYDVNGGYEISQKTQNITYDSNYTLPTPTKIGHTFMGWYNGNNKINSGLWKTASDTTLTAKWQINQ